MPSILPKIFCGIDTPDLDKAHTMIGHINELCGIKLGLEFFNANGAQGALSIAQTYPDTPIFLDLKYHDIPNTVAGAIRSVTQHFKPSFLNVHAGGGLEMMKAAKAACPDDVRLLAVTVLTSIDADELNRVGQGNDIQTQVIRLAQLTQEAGLDGVVCSPHEIELIRQTCGDDFITMVPGIRPTGSQTGDQKRIMTPTEAMTKGANHLVIGRPITQSNDPFATAQTIINSLS